MFTFMGGYHQRKPTDMWEKIHRGSIYLCPKARILGREAFAYGMIQRVSSLCRTDR